MSLPAFESFAGITEGQALAPYNPNFSIPLGSFFGKTGGAGLAAGGGDSLTYWNADTFNANHFSRLLVTGTGLSNGSCLGPAVRVTSGGSAYAAILNSEDGVRVVHCF